MAKTFKDLYYYIQKAKRDETGMHIPYDDNMYPRYGMHIYENRCQMNISRQDEPDTPFWAKAALIFRPEEGEVRLVRCLNSIAQYDEYNTISWDTEIHDYGWFDHLLDTSLDKTSAWSIIDYIQKFLIDAVESDGDTVEIPVESIRNIHREFNRVFDNIFGDILRQTNEVCDGPIYEYNNATGEIYWQ